MSEIYAWLFSIVGIVVLGSLVDLILPEGTMRKYIQGVYSIAVMLVVLMPIPNLLNKRFELADYFSKTEINSNYVENIYKQKITLLEQGIILELSEQGIENIRITIVTDGYSESMKIVQIIADKSLNTDASTEKIVEIVMKLSGVSKDKVALI